MRPKINLSKVPITEAQQELYNFLVDYINTHSKSPTTGQMAIAMKRKSKTAIEARLMRLKIKGYIDWQFNERKKYIKILK